MSHVGEVDAVRVPVSRAGHHARPVIDIEPPLPRDSHEYDYADLSDRIGAEYHGAGDESVIGR